MSCRDAFLSVESLVLGLAAASAVSLSAAADQILEIHNASLTTYVPSSKSNVQDVRPLPEQRGRYPDGSAAGQGGDCSSPICFQPHSCCVDALTCIVPGEDGSGIGDGTGGGSGDGPPNVLWLESGNVRYDLGTHPVWDRDLNLPAAIPWSIGRSYNARQKDSGGSYFASNGYQGRNWFQNSQPELVFHNTTPDSSDMIYLIYGADRFIEFRRGDVTTPGAGDSDDTFQAVNGAAGIILLHTFDGIDLATYYDQRGNRIDFFWFGDADIDDDIEGSIWRIMDPTITVDPYLTNPRVTTSDGNVAYVGDVGNPNTALSSGYDATIGAIKTAYDSAGRRFTYDYTSGRLDWVKAEVNTGSWVEVGRVDYFYYVAADSHGEDGDLELVTVTTPMTDSGISVERNKHYWYYEGTYDATTNPGYHHQIRYIIDFEGYRRQDWLDSDLDDTPLTASEGDLKPYASASIKYDTERRIKSAWFNGACGCSGAGSGEHTFEYETNSGYSDGGGYTTTWKARTIVARPKVTYQASAGEIASYVTQYFDEAGQPLHRVDTDRDPDNASPKFWATKVTRDGAGLVTEIDTPATVTAYTHSIPISFTVSSSAGLVHVITRETSGDLKGFLDDRRHSRGSGATTYFDDLPNRETRTLTVGNAGLTRPLTTERREYTIETATGSTGYYATTYAYTYHSGTTTAVQYLVPKRVTTTFPVVSTGYNGSGSANTRKHYLRKDGTAAFAEAEDGVFTYTQYTNGHLIKQIEDVTSSGSYDSADAPSNWSITLPSTGSNRTTTHTYDQEGRLDTTTLPDGRVLKHYYSKLADGRVVTLAYTKYVSSPLTFYGPVQYTVSNQAGRVEVQATVALDGNDSDSAVTSHVAETEADPIKAMDVGAVARLSLSVYDETGTTVEESRLYYAIDLTNGLSGSSYDATVYGYDDQGRRCRAKAPHGTITRTDYDTLGRVVRQWIGTNDSGFDGGETSGTDTMVKTLANEYDGSATSDKGNSYLTKRTAYVDSSTGHDTTFTNDSRGRMLLQSNPTAPYIFNKYDNLGRLLASGQYGSTASIDASADDPTTETTNRLGLSQSFYDELGRVYKTQRHKIDEADGSDDDTLQTLSWYDPAGRLIKQHGTQLTKTAYDRLGRTTRRYTIVKDTDSDYTNADDVTGDLVLLEQQTVFESASCDDVLMTVSIERYHDDKGAGQTTGALDTNADGDDFLVTASNLEGRAQITASWHDDFGRLTSTVRYGTNGGANFDRDGLTVPERTEPPLRTDNAYYDDGALKSLTDPKNLETRYAYDGAGRQVTVIVNYLNGTPSGVNGDDDVHTRFIYTYGLRTKLWVDFDGDNVEDGDDQVTTYTYGTTKGTGAGDSKIATGHLLKEAKYPDSSGAGDVVSVAYNAQGREIWRKDQAGNVIEIDYDNSGPETERRVTTLASGFDGAVRRISTTYDSLGRRQLVTQYDDATVGAPDTVVNEVKFTHEDWGNLEKLEQDHNSAVGASGSVDDLEISYTWAKSTSSTGWKALRRTGATLPDGTSLTYRYLSTSSLFDHDLSRLTTLSVGAVEVAEYWYNGVWSLVGIIHNEPDIFWKLYSSTSGTYPDLDQFNRITSSRWTKDLSTDLDFFDLDITYDRNSNIEVVEDNIHVQSAGFDVDYVMDGLNRLTRAEQGTWSGSAITTRKHDQQWTLDQVGNWDLAKLDVNGDGDFIDADDRNENRAHNPVNELTDRDLDTDADGQYDDTLYDLTYDAVGNLTDDGEHYEYVYDAFGRLRKIKNQSSVLVAEYKYNGLGHRICWHYDVDADGTVESTSDDPRYYFVYDERWRIVATYRDDDSTSDLSDEDPKEQFVYHAAGAGGTGGSSYIDNVILRDRDANTAWSAASDGTLEERMYYCHNWRGDISVLISAAGAMVEWVKYSAYGIPYGIPVGDTNSDGTVNSTDTNNISVWENSSNHPTGDTNLDGTINSTDATKVSNQQGTTLGWWALSDVGNRKGYAGYEADPNLADAIWHVRHRVLSSDLGRWTRRDPLGDTLAYGGADMQSFTTWTGDQSVGQCSASNGISAVTLLVAGGKLETDWWIDPGAPLEPNPDREEGTAIRRFASIDTLISGLYQYCASQPIGDTDPSGLGSAYCKVVCCNNGVRYGTFKFFMLGFCGSAIEAQGCCDMVAAVCSCWPPGSPYIPNYGKCWAEAYGVYIACLVAL